MEEIIEVVGREVTCPELFKKGRICVFEFLDEKWLCLRQVEKIFGSELRTLKSRSQSVYNGYINTNREELKNHKFVCPFKCSKLTEFISEAGLMACNINAHKTFKYPDEQRFADAVAFLFNPNNPVPEHVEEEEPVVTLAPPPPPLEPETPPVLNYDEQIQQLREEIELLRRQMYNNNMDINGRFDNIEDYFGEMATRAMQRKRTREERESSVEETRTKMCKTS